MVTDPARQYKTDPGHPEICNVMALHRIINNNSEAMSQIEADCRNAGIGCVAHKKQFAEELVRYLAPHRERRAELASDPNLVWRILADGAERARALAQETMSEVRSRVGLP